MEDRLEKLRDLAHSEPDDALAQFLLGREASGQGLHEEARAAFAAAVAIDPHYTAAYRHWGNAPKRWLATTKPPLSTRAGRASPSARATCRRARRWAPFSSAWSVSGA